MTCNKRERYRNMYTFLLIDLHHVVTYIIIELYMCITRLIFRVLFGDYCSSCCSSCSFNYWHQSYSEARMICRRIFLIQTQFWRKTYRRDGAWTRVMCTICVPSSTISLRNSSRNHWRSPGRIWSISCRYIDTTCETRDLTTECSPVINSVFFLCSCHMYIR